MSSFETASKSISELVKDFKSNDKYYLSAGYFEATEEETKVVEKATT